MSDEDYMKMHNEVAAKENAKAEAAKERKASMSAERKATGKSKKAYREEYDRLIAAYKVAIMQQKKKQKRLLNTLFKI
jgi:hypothetical protein